MDSILYKPLQMLVDEGQSYFTDQNEAMEEFFSVSYVYGSLAKNFKVSS